VDANAFRHFYGYHFSQNRVIWDTYITQLTDAQFTQEAGYSAGSVRNQVVHMMSVDEAWFKDLGGVEFHGHLKPEDFPERQSIRAYWDGVEGNMRAYLDELTDEMLSSKPFTEGRGRDLVLWQVLLHVANHGTDHRSQLLRLLNDLGVETKSQDYIFYVYEHN
jgi:uncharacterized damage-inducible protein DinB